MLILNVIIVIIFILGMVYVFVHFKCGEFYDIHIFLKLPFTSVFFYSLPAL